MSQLSNNLEQPKTHMPNELVPITQKLPGWSPDDGKKALGAFNQGNWTDSSLPGNIYSSSRWYDGYSPGTAINYAAAAGPLWSNSAVQAVLNWIIRAWPESYPCVKQTGSGGKKLIVDNHPLTAILMNPNTYDDDTTLWGGTIVSFWCDGNAYWRINRDRGGRIAEFEFVPHWAISPYREVDSTNPGPDYYKLNTIKGPIEIDPWDIVHYRFGKDPNNDLLGMSPWASVCREVYTDNEACNYTATTLRNRGTAWMIVSPSAKDEGFEDPTQIRDIIEARTTGDNRGRVVVLDVGANIATPGPMKDMEMAILRNIPTRRICAMAGISVDSVDLGANSDHVTFQNQKSADAKSWNTLVQIQRMIGRQLTKQVLWEPKNYNIKPNTLFAGFDYSEVRALEINKVEEWNRIRNQFDAHLLTDDEARAEMGYDPFTSDQRTALAAQIQAELPAVAVPEAVPVPRATSTGGKSGNGTGKHSVDANLPEISRRIQQQIAAGAWRATQN